MQIYTPGYLQNGKSRPVTLHAPSTLTYGQIFSFNFSGVPAIDRVVLNRYGCMSLGCCKKMFDNQASNVFFKPVPVILALCVCEEMCIRHIVNLRIAEFASLSTG